MVDTFHAILLFYAMTKYLDDFYLDSGIHGIGKCRNGDFGGRKECLGYGYDSGHGPDHVDPNREVGEEPDIPDGRDIQGSP
jgi:hypothetical protein